MRNLFEKIRQKRSLILLFSLIALFYLTYGCPIRLLSGIACPGCGMSRAILAAARLDFPAAFEMHPLVFLLPAAVTVFFLRKHIPKKLMTVLCISALILLTAVYAVRMSYPSDVVYADFESGLIYRLFYKISQLKIF